MTTDLKNIAGKTLTEALTVLLAACNHQNWEFKAFQCAIPVGPECEKALRDKAIKVSWRRAFERVAQQTKAQRSMELYQSRADFRPLPDPVSVEASGRFREPLEPLINLLRTGELVCAALALNSEHTLVSPAVWQRPDIVIDAASGDVLSMEGDGLAVMFRSVTLRASNTVRQEYLVRNKGVAELIRVRVSGERVRKGTLLQEAQARFPGLSVRRFDEHWAELAPAEWKKKGRPRALKKN